MILQPVVNIAEICARKGVQQVVLSPGSRCAPLTLAFARHPKLSVRTVSDERAAAFIGLGMAQKTGSPTVLVCTSGTAALNYAPAVAEAYFQQVPLLILTADRPPEWIDQLDGQTIRQEQVYGRHIKESYTFPVDFDHPDAVWHSERLVSEALNKAIAFPPGPVHINIPLREPFYPAPGEALVYSEGVKIIEEEASIQTLGPDILAKLRREFHQYERILVVAGQGDYDALLLPVLETFAQTTGAVIVGDIISNTQQSALVIRHQDTLLSCQDDQQLALLRPDLLVTFGKSIMSKSLKVYLRKHPPKAHWHLQPAGQVADTFQSLTKIVRCSPRYFFTTVPERQAFSLTYLHAWQGMERRAENFLEEYVPASGYNELHLVRQILRHLPAHSNLHLANSMAVRYANILALKPAQQVQVYANRGTSGIDGSTSTAVGCALVSTQPTVLITGDLAFFYDRNALWHNYLPQNLRIVLLNNHAGGIFRLIDGPRQQPELAPYFETHQALDARNTARDFKMRYTAVTTLAELSEALPAFFSPTAGAAILEVFTDSALNAKAFSEYKQAAGKLFSGI
ncbi:2-succinyl-5-enolpyruvyl-6-hydroxy-3-cyclohexene-1-carboxylic-acid synthase [Pontibacter sp. E15-1]|uniref:2-succinyl-5-enolpyruvyl-6-hydroxy-3- cyclohexene-1-carboxylic-acid synthase n=1 Tax=Pontibacter sp. E15-1 TaxID=2919918 RepID=UPI001F4F6355|nr:2-succinyl-5-enolpyruvyl-6-hydroxy-3-cyclohexene-1-carboxylic-acid synthase [Pontibacter sp. E15-1]MCJ8167055.1 2-succinyl-5-enolpyruvyl-6-hydroxy-3-cyclohexene-1-carboxylic-acid synthase [Pontibacter sp. E15-1]